MANIVKWKQSAALNIVGVRDGYFGGLIYSVFINLMQNSYSFVWKYLFVDI